MKIIVIGLVFGKVSFYVKADLMTIIHPADINTLKRNFQLVKISWVIWSSNWTNRSLDCLKINGIKNTCSTHVVYHRLNDAQISKLNELKKS